MSIASSQITKEIRAQAMRERRRRYQECLADRLSEMNREKTSFPASNEWHDDETALFEALYLRQYRPLVPATWDMQLRGVPVPDHIFSRNLFDNGEFGAPPIYPASLDGDCQASKAFMCIADLSTHIRALRQLGHNSKIALYLRDEIDRYLQWSINDAGLADVIAVPNIFCSIVDTSIHRTTDDIADFISDTTRKVAKQHEFFWENRAVKLEAEGDLVTVDAPVVTGLFVLNQTVMVCTLDPNRGVEGQISYHVAIDFARQNQNFWNALTLGIAVCMARDAMLMRDMFLKPPFE